MYTPQFGDTEIWLPSDFLTHSVSELQAEEAATQFVAVIDLKVKETLDNMWYGFRVGIARNFIFGASALFSIADQLEALLNPDYLY